MLRQMHLVEVLALKGECCHDFTTAFALLSDERQTLPCLRKLQIWPTHLSNSLGPADSEPAEKLESAFTTRNRSRIGAPALQLELRDCHISPTHLRKFEEALGTSIEVLDGYMAHW